MRLAGYVACMGRVERCTHGIVGKHEVKKSLGIHRRKWKDNIKKDLQEV
jgi:hypothetical protein